MQRCQCIQAGSADDGGMKNRWHIIACRNQKMLATKNRLVKLISNRSDSNKLKTELKRVRYIVSGNKKKDERRKVE